jgi:signal transduction histidine kinase
VVQDTLLNKLSAEISAKRKYYKSSSFAMAVIFTLFLGLASATLVYFMYSYGNGKYISKNEVVISATTYEHIMMLGIGSIMLMSAVVIISFILSIFVVSRINNIGVTAKEIIETGDLSRRISVDTKWDDLSNLAHLLNTLLEKAEHQVDDIRQVTDSIAHDLRTPLTRLRNQLETEKLPHIAAEADKIIVTFNALLRISNIEKGKRHSRFELANIYELVNDVIELYEPLAEERNITLNKHLEGFDFECDKDLLFQAFVNLLDNAIKFTPDGGNIEVRLENNNLIISDSGIGIADEDKQKVFTRFFRAESSRTTAGNGLGLSLVAEVMKLHKLKIKLEDTNPGLRVVVSF